MIDRLVALILDESKWLTLSMGCALAVVTLLLLLRRRPELPARDRIQAAMNLFFGITIGTMALGHLLAVSAKLLTGALEGSIPVFYLIGIVLAVPAWWLVVHTRQALAKGDDRGPGTLVLNAWLAITLLALGVYNLPLAAPAFLNIAYRQHSGRALGWAIVGMAVAVNLGLFIGSLIFLLSGQSFEQFKGVE